MEKTAKLPICVFQHMLETNPELQSFSEVQLWSDGCGQFKNREMLGTFSNDFPKILMDISRPELHVPQAQQVTTRWPHGYADEDQAVGLAQAHAREPDRLDGRFREVLRA